MRRQNVYRFGKSEILDFESRKNVAEWQVEDIQRLGTLLVSCAVRTNFSSETIELGMIMLKKHYSSEFYDVVEILLGGKVDISEVLMMTSMHMCDEFDIYLTSYDCLHENLRREYENSRLLRLLIKLGFVNERPDNTIPSAWSETGDRYVLKLFRDFLFHQKLSDDSPILDCGHIISTLNKIDAGDGEEILLSSRNGEDMLVVTHADVHRCLENAFLELSSQSQVLN